MDGLQEIAERMLGRCDRTLNSTLGGTPLTEMHLMDGVVLDRREMHDGIALVAAVAQHQGTTSRISASVRRPSSSGRVQSARAARGREKRRDHHRDFEIARSSKRS
jgi:hypothetical protein